LSLDAVHVKLTWPLVTPDVASPLGAVGGCVSAGLPAALNATTSAPQLSDPSSVLVADTGPAPGCSRSSTSSFVPGAAGTRSSITNPDPAVNVAALAVETSPITSSPLSAVVTDPLLAVAPVPCPAVPISNEFTAARPAYSRMATRSVPPEIDDDTDTVVAPPATASA
jgi:hypothetical protein